MIAFIRKRIERNTASGGSDIGSSVRMRPAIQLNHVTFGVYGKKD
jgi:hypothetical protein